MSGLLLFAVGAPLAGPSLSDLANVAGELVEGADPGDHGADLLVVLIGIQDEFAQRRAGGLECEYQGVHAGGFAGPEEGFLAFRDESGAVRHHHSLANGSALVIATFTMAGETGSMGTITGAVCLRADS